MRIVGAVRLLVRDERRDTQRIARQWECGKRLVLLDGERLLVEVFEEGKGWRGRRDDTTS